MGDVYESKHCPMWQWKEYLNEDELDRQYLGEVIELINLVNSERVKFTYTEWQELPDKLKEGLRAYDNEVAEIAEEKKNKDGLT